ncbi:MAG: OmpH family outer membrane protein [Bacteroidetes bacterium]|nr:OmpH family outer membrane protein [Bacteroidota bacterium]
MKKALLLFFFVSLVTFAQTQKVGYVNTQTIMEQYSGAIAAQAKIDNIVSALTKERDQLTQGLQTAYDNYQKQQGTMTEEKKAQVQQELVKKQQEIQQFEQVKFAQPNGEIYVKNEEIMVPVRNNVKAAIDAVAKDMGYNFIFDKSSDVLLLYADDSFDITLEVLLKLKKSK